MSRELLVTTMRTVQVLNDLKDPKDFKDPKDLKPYPLLTEIPHTH